MGALRLAPATLALIPALFTGCAGGDSPQSRDEVRRQGNEICRDMRRQGASPTATTPADFARQQRKVADTLAGGARRFRALDPRAVDRPAVNAYARSLRRQEQKARGLVNAVGRRDDQALKRLLGPRQARLNAENDRLARPLRLGDCLTER